MRNSLYGSIVLGALITTSLALNAPVQAQDYPVKPIKIIVPNPPGGSNDLVGRLVAERLRNRWGQPVLVENRAGASGRIGAEYVSKSAPDGYTLLASAPAALVINKILDPKLSYDSDRFVPVSIITAGTGVLVVHSSVAATNLQQLIDYAKANPGKLTYASQGTGTIAHLAGALFDLTNSVKTVHVPYKGSAPAVADLVGGQVNMSFSELATALQHIHAGRLRALGVGSAKRHPLLPNVPVLADSMPGFLFSYWTGMVAPAGTPAAIARRLSAEVAEGLKDPELLKRVQDASLDPVGTTPEETAAFFKSESERWGRVIRLTGIKEE